MKLKSLVCHHIGPFDATPMTFEPDLTVITGRNDTGKSCVLRAIQLMLSRDPNDLAREQDVNLDHISGVSKQWTEDDRIMCEGAFSTKRYGQSPKDSKLRAKVVTSKVGSTTYSTPDKSGSGIAGVKNFPQCLLFRQEEDQGVRPVVDVNSMNPTERRFVGVAFGPQFSPAALPGLSDHKFEQIIGRAEATLNKRLEQLLPPTLAYRFRLKAIANDRHRLLVSLIDDHHFATDIEMRGTGIRKLINLLARLAIENIGNEPTIILIDEPETSLHADAQHMLRQFLEELATREHLQVIYTTHSPCMVNSMRPETLRLMERVQVGETAFSRMNSKPIGEGFMAIRSSLGISPSDSLLYAPVTIVVEGPTERLCLPLLLARLAKEKIEGFEDAASLLGSSTIIDAGGTPNIPNLTRIALGHGSRVVVFVDGDVPKSWRNQFTKDHPQTPLIIMPDGEEFEQIVPQPAYLATVQKELELPDDVTHEAFEEWLKQESKKRAFTKQVEWWLDHRDIDRSLDKPMTMRAALANIDIAELRSLEPVKQLLAQVRMLLRN